MSSAIAKACALRSASTDSSHILFDAFTRGAASGQIKPEQLCADDTWGSQKSERCGTEEINGNIASEKAMSAWSEFLVRSSFFVTESVRRCRKCDGMLGKWRHKEPNWSNLSGDFMAVE
jgi:hypothetical protein